ncbi:DUF6640 family protein [Acidisoma silvae]|uniref:Uncharacterized protein n=1 Tax=Acidisoma silvae TaxID=2802396 RepID=A0A964E1A4_9PROT|nr:DUF6640 family protein [Acidisoma silvae]MCB8878370.1 hypothetical protein [Acidisoma silvae]
METARWIIVFVAAVTAVGGLCADWFIPYGARQHLKNPAWKPHAKFHNAQGILMGTGQGMLAIGLLMVMRLSLKTTILSALIASLYWVALMFARLFPDTAWVDPEFAVPNPHLLGLAPQQLIGWMLLSLLALAVLVASLAG